VKARLTGRFLVLKPGFFTTIQDLGRFGCLRYGVPISGAMDQFSLVAANVLVGNKPNDACLETTLIGPQLQVLDKTQIAIAGAECSPKINGKSAPTWRTLEAKKGDVVSFGSMRSGCRAYLSARGGIDVPVVLGSRSTHVRGGFGGLNGRALRNDDIIDCFDVPPQSIEYSLPEKLLPSFADHVEAGVVMGPQADMFTEAGVDTFFSGSFKITSEADRMGYRLDGPQVEHSGSADIVSDALLPGAVQVPRDGRPIVVMREAQTTGGYAKIAVVISPDLTVLGQAKPGCSIRFSRVSLSEAQERSREFFRLLNGLSSMLVDTQ
jgi:antagonist of KipI